MSRSKLLLFSLFTLALLAALPICAADGAAQAPSVQAPAALPAAGCQPAFDFANVSSCQAPALTAPANQVPAPEFLANKHLGYCHCGCGPATCRTSADCGGASCDPVPSCC
jgi:hypothetical protein